MRKLLKPANIAFYFLTLIVFFIIGIYFAGVTGAGKNQGLAGGAVVVGWGALFGSIAFIASFFIVYFASHKVIVRLNLLLLAIFIVAYGITHYGFLQKQKKKEKEILEQPLKKTTTIVSPVETIQLKRHVSLSEKQISVSFASLNNFTDSNTELGLGFFTPNFFENSTFYFYGNVNTEKPVNEHIPQDSITFKQSQYGFDIEYAPPYFYPEHLKLDYDMLFLRVLAVGRNFIEVEVNRETRQIAYVDRYKGKLLYWPEFLLGIHSVEFKENANQTVRFKPLEHASEVSTKFDFMQPQLIKDEWMKVDLLDNNFNKTGEGWIRWKQNNKLIISYSLLS
jgi:hypothetical protein